MPHLTLEHCDSLTPLYDPGVLFRQLHRDLSIIADTAESSFKSRVITVDRHYLGCTTDQDAVLVFLRMNLMSGRSPEVKAKIKQCILSSLREQFSSSEASPAVTIRYSVLLQDMIPVDYLVYP